MGFFSTPIIDPQSITDKLIPNGFWPFFVQLISTIVMLVIVHKFLYLPIKAILDKRAEFVNQTIHDAIQREKQAELVKLSLEEQTKKVQLSLKELKEEAMQEIEATRSQLLNDAKADASRIKEKTLEEIAQAKSQALYDIEKEIVSVALDASKQVLQRELSNKDNEKVIEDFIKGLRN